MKITPKLMSDSANVDRGLARALDVFRSTIRRARQWLQANGFVEQWPLIHDLQRIGFKLVMLALSNARYGFLAGELEDVESKMRCFWRKYPKVVRVLHGEGTRCGGIHFPSMRVFRVWFSFARTQKLRCLILKS